MNANIKTARLAGILYVVVIICGVFAEFFVRSSLIVSGDTAETMQNIKDHEFLFRLGIMADVVAHTFYFFLALALYTLLKPINANITRLFLLIVVICAPILILNMLNQFMALFILTEADYLSAFTTAQLDGLVMLFLDLHKYGYLIAQMFYGGWLLPLGYVVYKSGYFPKLIGGLLMVAAVGYLLDFFTAFLAPAVQADITGIVLAPAVIGESALCLWLLARGVKRTATQAVYAPSAPTPLAAG